MRGLYMVDLFEKSNGHEKEKKHVPSLEIFARKEGRASKRYGSKKPIENIKKQEILLAWREEDL